MEGKEKKVREIYGKIYWLASVGTLNLSETNWGLKSLKSLPSYAAANNLSLSDHYVT